MQNQTCDEFIQALSSKAPIPGGGGASAYVAAIGTALGSMVGNLTLGKKKYADVQPDIEELLKKSERLIQHFSDLVKQDGEAFAPLAVAYRMPKETQQEKMAKEEALQSAVIGAAEVPLKIAKLCVEAISLHEEFGEKGTVMAISDIGCGVIFCKAALLGARLNVLINLDIMADQKLKMQLKAEIDETCKAGIALADKIYHDVEGKLCQSY